MNLIKIFFLTLSLFVFSTCSNRSELYKEAPSPSPKQSSPQKKSVVGKSGISDSEGGEITPQPKLSSNESNSFTENPFMEVKKEKFSTFSLKVDTASYSFLRSQIKFGQKPNSDSVRIEEMVNYIPWRYNFSNQNEDPIFMHSELAVCPWNENRSLLRIVFQTNQIPASSIPPMNLVFLLDVSGSMSDSNKLPLLKNTLIELTKSLRKEDKIAIVVYASKEGLVLPSTKGSDKEEIISALENLNSGGSTNGGAGITLAYKTAQENFIQGGINRIILGTDGDFNVGVSGNQLIDMIKQYREKNIYITLLGLGMGNFKDSTMENISKEGNGNYFYIDSEEEAKKVFEENFSGTLMTVANDTKLQVEFNPKSVSSYRLIGYENRLLATKDFKDDKKDAGEIGPGHVVTAFYELNLNQTAKENLGIVRSRYKIPNTKTVKEISLDLNNQKKIFKESSSEFQLASGMILFGLLLKDSKHKSNGNWKLLDKILENQTSNYLDKYKKELIELKNLSKK